MHRPWWRQVCEIRADIVGAVFPLPYEKPRLFASTSSAPVSTAQRVEAVPLSYLLVPLALLLQLMSLPASAEIWLGMEVDPVPRTTAVVYDLTPSAGAHVAKTIAGGPADRADLASGDIILRINYTPVIRPRSVLRITQNLQAGQFAPVQILRYGKIMQLYIVPRPRGEAPIESHL